MNVLLCGASGFVGRHLEAALLNAGHRVIRGIRHPSRPGDIAVDYRNDIEIQTWLPRLAGIDAVVNAIGVLRDSPAQPMSRLHDAAPRALFAAAARNGVKRIVHISALGVGRGLKIPYLLTKQAADDFLQTLDLDWAILRPSIIYGKEGASTRMFLQLSHLPVLMLPEGGRQIVQPVHIDDVAQTVALLLAPDTASPPLRRIIECVGAEPVSLAGLISSYRMQRGSRAPWVLATPSLLLKPMVWLGDRIPAMPIGSDTLAMLAAGNTGDADKFAGLLGRAPRGYREFLHDQ
ncbi:MAG TPA: NAD(P)H-binding protein [Gallionellaceae bacterium]